MSTSRGIALLLRDLQLTARRPTQAWLGLAFLLACAVLFPLGVGPEANTLRQIAPGVVWVCALLATMLSLTALYGADFADGSLEQMLLSGYSLVEVTLAKSLAHWLVTGLPLVVATPMVGILFGLPAASVALLALTVLLGTPVLSLLGGFGAALTLGLPNGVVLLLLLVLPLCMPILIFGSGAVAALESGTSAAGHLYLLAAMLLITLAGAPFATAAALRIAL